MRAPRRQLPHRQKGAALLLIIVAIAALIGIAGLAIDASHVGYMKARLQATVDAMALSAAKRLDQVGTAEAACDAALKVLEENEDQFHELRDSHPPTTSCAELPWLSIEYSLQPTPFIPVSDVAPYVRVRVSDVSTGASLSRALGFIDLEVAASAIAGPSAPLAYLCSLLPVAVCGDKNLPNFGFVEKGVYVLKGKKNEKDADQFGDFHLLSPDEDPDDGCSTTSGSDSSIREDMAGGFAGCRLVSNGTGVRPKVCTESGNKTGPVVKGINTRFNDYKGSGGLSPNTYPPDVLTFEASPALTVDTKNGNRIYQGKREITPSSRVIDATGSVVRDRYLELLKDGPYDVQPPPSGVGAFLRREVAVPIVECDKIANPALNPLPVLGAGCFFLLQRMDDGASDSRLFGEYIPNCEAAGRPGPNPGDGGPYTIQLFRNTASSDS